MAEWLGSGLQHHLQQFESARYLKKMLVLNNKHILFIPLVLLSFTTKAQCDYNLDNLSHIDCNGDNTGEIDITITNSSVTCSWLYPDGITTNWSVFRFMGE